MRQAEYSSDKEKHMARSITGSISNKLLLVIASCVVVVSVVLGAYLFYFRAQLVSDRSTAMGKRLVQSTGRQGGKRLSVCEARATFLGQFPHTGLCAGQCSSDRCRLGEEG